MELAGKVALVTGAGSGIGKAAALLLAKAGARIGALSRTEAEVRQTADEIEAAGGEAVLLVADAAEAEPMRQAVEQLVARFGRLDIVFANAGINGVWAPIDELQPAEWDQTIAVNLRGTYLTLHHAVPHLKRAGAGSIIITASINGTRTFTSAGATAYACTKAAQVAMTQMLALELAKHRIRINVICPGAIDTEINDNTFPKDVEKVKIKSEFSRPHPLRDAPGTSQQCADLALFLASDASSHITGTPVWIDGAESLLRG